jgi:hypothetical protein
LSFVNFQEKLTGTSWNLCACEASLFGLLCAWREVQILRQQYVMAKRPFDLVDIMLAEIEDAIMDGMGMT